MTAAPLLLLLAGLAVQDQDPVRVQVGLTRSSIHVGETTTLRVDVRTDGARAEIGRITRLPPGVELVGSRDYDQRQFSLPGGTRRFVSREFVLRGRAPGTFRIPEVGVRVDGQSYTASSQVLTVTPPPPGLRGPPGGASGSPESGVGLNAWLETDTAYVGQQVTMNAEAMFSQAARLRLRRAPEYEAPSPSGFWVDDLPDRRSVSSRVMDGDVYEVQGFRRAFFPLSPGRYVVPPARLEYEMRRGILYAPETFEVRSDSMPLVVLPVPEEGRPPEFTGAVGRFEVRSSLEPAEVPAGEAAVLTVVVEGVGNVKALPPPALPDLPGVEVFPPSEDAASRVENGRVGGTKTFSWVLIPSRTGTIEIPPVRYGYFDPQARRFAVAEAGLLELTVRPGTGSTVAESRPTALRYLKTEPTGPDPLGFVRTPWFAVLQLLPLLALAAGWRASRGGGGVSRRELRRRRREGMGALERKAEAGDRAVLGEADSFIRSWVAERLGLRPAEVGRSGALAGAGVSPGTASAVASALERIATLRYAPTPPERGALVQAIEEAGDAVRRVDREAPAPPGPAGSVPRGAASALVLVLAAGVVTGLGLWPAPAAAQEPRSSDGAGAFAEGIRHYDAGRFDDAAEVFEARARARPRDPAGWYNLGTAYYRAGHPGYATWAWLRALSLDPRDADSRHNLEVVGARPELLARVAPALPLRPTEFLLLGSVAWLLAGGAGAWWLSRRGRRTGIAAAVALLAAVSLGAAWLASIRSTETLVVLEPATLRAGPTLGADPLEDLEPGSGLVPVVEYGDWLRVRTLGGTEGWIENRSAGAL